MLKKLPKGPTLRLELKYGVVTCRLFENIARKHVNRISQLVSEGCYDNVVFHRVIDGFMAQTGDVQFGNKVNNFSPQNCGTGGSNEPNLEQEFSDIDFQ